MHSMPAYKPCPSCAGAILDKQQPSMQDAIGGTGSGDDAFIPSQ